MRMTTNCFGYLLNAREPALWAFHWALGHRPAAAAPSSDFDDEEEEESEVEPDLLSVEERDAIDLAGTEELLARAMDRLTRTCVRVTIPPGCGTNSTSARKATRVRG